MFRREYGNLVAALATRVGVQHIDNIEDAVQNAIVAALDTWTRDRTPDKPSAWLYRVACNSLLDELRTHTRRADILYHSAFGDELQDDDAALQYAVAGFSDDLLRLLFACCDEQLPIQSQLVFALKTICGFSIDEISARLYISSDNVYKRFSRARTYLKNHPPRLDELTDAELQNRLPAVLKVLYLLFTEGHLSLNSDSALRIELCREAIRLTELVAGHPLAGYPLSRPQTSALLALMHLHMARMHTRLDATGGLLLLEEQDRSLWCQHSIAEGLRWLARSADGEEFSRYHAEAGIAAAHCMATSFADTDWASIVQCYTLLQQTNPSPIHQLNCAIAMAEWQGPERGLAMLTEIAPPSWLAGSYLWAAVLADLYRRCHQQSQALRYREIALATAPSPHIQKLLKHRLRFDEDEPD